MVMSMDAINDQTMSSTFDDSATINSDSYKQPESADDELNDEELSKGSSQTIVVKRQQQQLQQQQPACVDGNDDEKCHQPMIVSRGSSVDEDQKQTKMNLDEDSSSDEPLPPTSTKSVTKTEECAGMKQSLTAATSLRLASGMDSKNSRVDSLVAQMRDIVDGGQTSRMNTELATTREHHHEDDRPQPKSSSDSLNNQNEINTSKASIEGVGAQKRTRRTRGHCRHGHHHHHHHHHGSHQRHKQDSEKSSIVGVDNVGAVGVGTCDPASQGINPHQHHHHHHHRHQTNSSSTHRPHAHSHSHPHHHHHHHHGHHHHPNHEHHHQGERRGTMSKRSSIQRPSLALIDPTGGSLNLVLGTCQIGDEEDENLTNRDLNSSISSTSSNPVAVGQQTSKQASQQNINNNPNQSYPESKSSESPPDEKNSGEVDNATTEMQQKQRQRETEKSQEQQSGHHQHHQHRHHHHHHRCHHRSHKKRLALDSSNDFKSSTKADESGVQTLGGEDGTKREVLGDLKSSLNTSPGAAARQLDHENHCEAHSISKGASHSHGHPHSHSHHHHHHPHPHHHHHVHCVASAHKLTDDNNNNQSKSTEEQQANKAQHHHHHRHHKHHHHYHHHGHHCKQHRHKTRRKSDVQSNVDLSSSREQTNNQSTSTAGGRVKLDSLNNNDCNVANTKLAGADEPTTNQRRISSVSAAGGAGGKMNMDLEVTNDMQTIINDKQEAKEDDVVDMEMSPSNERRASRVQQQTCESSASTNVPAASGPGASMTATHEAVILRSVRQEVVGSDVRHASQLNALNQQDNNNNQMQIQSAKDGDKDNSNQCSIEPNQKSTQNDDSSGYKFSGSYESNQENLYKGSNVGDVSGRENKLVRQMSSHSSKKSQKDDVGRDGESQSQQLADYAPRPLQSGSNQESTQATQIIESSVPNDRRCRLCWCCCCPCSALSVREVANRTDTVKSDADPSNSPTNKLPPTPNVPLEEVRSWGESFDKLMRCQAGRKVFQDFLRCEYSEENILFWTACEDLKKERDSKSIASKARDIYEDYISILSSKEVSLDSRVRDVINNNIKKPTSNIFDEAQLQIYTLMHRDSYPRFINSNMYKKLAQLSASNSSRKSSS